VCDLRNFIVFSRARGSAVAMPQAESCTLAGVARAYVCRQWQGLNRDFQSCCVALETFDVHAWVERNVTMESALGTYSIEWTQPQIDEAQKVLICGFYARRLGNDVFWKRVYCKRHDVEMSGLPLIEMASAEEAVGAAQEASTEAMIASPWSEFESEQVDPPTPLPPPAVPAGILVSQSPCRGMSNFLVWMEQEIMPRLKAWMDLIADVVRCLADELLGVDGVLSMQVLQSFAVFDTDFIVCLEPRLPARFCCEAILMHIMFRMASLRFQT